MIKEIFINLLKAFPYQMLWKLVPMLKVNYFIVIKMLLSIYVLLEY
jgi:hypothetical protein